MASEKHMEVRAIENGTVIDHIPASCLFKIIDILQLEKETNRITFGTNLESERMGAKAIIKINNRYCKPEEINRIALVAPMARVNIIKNYLVTEKLTVEVPTHIEGFVKCANPHCITNQQPVKTAFEVLKHNDRIALKCRYCEKTTYQAFEIIK